MNTKNYGKYDHQSMMASVKKAGGLFYQYRACKRDESIIYDIENIRHGVVYAQTPLNMNDPFDSVIGFSPDSFIEECITEIINVESANDPVLKDVLIQFFKYKAVGKFTEFVKRLNDLKRYILQKRQSMHQTHTDLKAFISSYRQVLYGGCPKALKSYFTQSNFLPFSLLVANIDTVNITEKEVNDAYQIDTTIEALRLRAAEIRDHDFIPQIHHFLEQLTVTCFSASGWRNQLMWAHYANSYSGICIEYDFTKIADFVGFIYPVEYSKKRPLLRYSDIGLRFSMKNHKAVVDTDADFDITQILSYLLVKNDCWKYEDEWRIINCGKPNTPIFIPLPHIMSITFGLHVDDMCKALLWDVCKEKGIECYQLIINTENYEIDRRLVTDADFPYDEDRELQYIQLLVKQFNDAGIKVDNFAQPFTDPDQDSPTDFTQMPKVLEGIIDMLSGAYFLKAALNRFARNTNDDFSSIDEAAESLESLSNVDCFVDLIRENANTLVTTVPNLHRNGIIRQEIYRKSSHLLSNIFELTDKYRSLEWDSKIDPQRVESYTNESSPVD